MTRRLSCCHRSWDSSQSKLATENFFHLFKSKTFSSTHQGPQREQLSRFRSIHVQQFLDYGEENNHIQTRKIVLTPSIPLWIEIFAWRGFLARRYCNGFSARSNFAIMPEIKSRQKPKDYDEETTQFLRCLRKNYPNLQLKTIQDNIRRADDNELCLPLSWRVSSKSSSLYQNSIMSTRILTFLVFC